MTPDYWLERQDDSGVFTPASDAARSALVEKSELHARGYWSHQADSVVVPGEGRVESIVMSLMAAGWTFAFASQPATES